MRQLQRPRSPLVTFLLVLVAVWVLVSVLGLIVRALFFLTVIGVIALIATAAWAGFRSGRRG